MSLPIYIEADDFGVSPHVISNPANGEGSGFEIAETKGFGPRSAVSAMFAIPRETDWVTQGAALAAGPPGAWDARLSGMISPCAVLKKDGTYYLYYLGADGDRSTDGGPRNRALGVAISNDGIAFTKYAGNPVITYSPHGNEEEGVFSCGAHLDETGKVRLYYGAIRAPDATSERVDVDIRLQTSGDGLSFTDDTLIRHQAGRELTPIGVFLHRQAWRVLYLGPLGGGQGPLKVLSGTAPDSLLESSVAIEGEFVGGGDLVWLNSEYVALFLSKRGGQRTIEVRVLPAADLLPASESIETYHFGDQWSHQTVLLDTEETTWFMYHRFEDDEIYVRTAAAKSVVEEDERYPLTFLDQENSNQQVLMMASLASLLLVAIWFAWRQRTDV